MKAVISRDAVRSGHGSAGASLLLSLLFFSLLFSPAPCHGAASPRQPAPGVSWREWGAEAFSEAQRRDSPIVLFLTASWCYWCRVMDERVWSDSTVIDHVRARYVPIRVDRDRRPDVDRRYHAGGWPSTVFLTPQGDIIAGDTFGGVEELRPRLVQVSHYYRHNREELAQKVREFRQQQEERSRRSPAEDTGVSRSILREVTGEILSPGRADRLFGGLGTKPKFPSPAPLGFSLWAYGEGVDPELLGFARVTLDALRRGAIYDQVGNGFHRYSESSDWSRPHFEKLLGLNAELAEVYLQAFETTGDSTYLDTAQRTVTYLRERLYQKDQSLFGGSESADNGLGREGAYYTWTAPEIERSVPARAAPLLIELYGYSLGRRDETRPRPLHTVLRLEEAAERAGVSRAEAPALLEEGLAALSRARRRRPPPAFDRTVFVDANCQAIITLLRLSRLLPEGESEVEMARGVMAALRARGCEPALPVPHWLGSSGDAPLLLHDQVLFTQALLALYQECGDPALLKDAREAARALTSGFRPGPGRALADRISQKGDPLELTTPVWDIEDNGRAVRLLLALAELTGEEALRDEAESILLYFLPDYREYSYFAGEYARATECYLRAPLRVVVVGRARDARTKDLIREAHLLPHGWKVVEPIDPARHGERLEARGFPPSDIPVAYLCQGRACSLPVRDPARLAIEVREFLSARRGP